MSFAPREESLSLDDRQKIHGICTHFEEEWLAGRRPLIEPYLQQIHIGAQPVLLGELLQLELDYRRSLGEDLSKGLYLQRFPRMRETVEATFQTALARPVPVRFLPGTMIGRYQVRRTLGTGASAVVLLAWDSQLEREVAVKVPHRFLLSDPAMREQFLAEARLVARLRHPRIVTLHDVAEMDKLGTIYLVMEYIGGMSLRQRLERGPLLPDQASGIAAKVADAMAAAHRAGVFHRDLKPSNILLDEQGEPHVCDFGLALHVEDQRGRAGEFAGTVTYMAPEQIRGESHRLDGRADIWALGVILYEMLTGTPPFAGRYRDELFDEILHRDPRPPRQVEPRVSREQQRVCLRCLAKEPDARFSSANDVARALRQDKRQGERLGLLSRWGKLLVALALLLAAGTWWVGARHPGPAAPAPLDGTMELLVWDARRPDRQGVRVVEPASLPLCDGDRVRLSAQMNQPVYLYLLWLDAQGAVLPVYPWRAGSWDRHPDDEQPRVALSLPAKQDDGWRMHVEQDGLETLLLLARRTPLPASVDLRPLIEGVSRGLPPAAPVAVWFQDGCPAQPERRVETAAQRPPDLQAVEQIPDPLLRMQRRTAERLRPHFELIRAVSFPVQREVAHRHAASPTRIGPDARLMVVDRPPFPATSAQLAAVSAVTRPYPLRGGGYRCTGGR